MAREGGRERCFGRKHRAEGGRDGQFQRTARRVPKGGNSLRRHGRPDTLLSDLYSVFPVRYGLCVELFQGRGLVINLASLMDRLPCWFAALIVRAARVRDVPARLKRPE
jgi:hypothetical protein